MPVMPLPLGSRGIKHRFQMDNGSMVRART